MRVAPTVTLSNEQRAQLEMLARGRSLPLRLVQRARIVILAAAGRQDREIGQELGITRQTAGRWRKRYLLSGVAGIEKDAPRTGRKRKISDSTVRRIVNRTTQERPAQATHWSTRTLAQAVGVSPATVRRIWKVHGLKPHRVKTFKLSNDKHFAEKFWDVIGLYLNPPDRALVLCCDEKSQCQALERTQPGLPVMRGYSRTQTHDYKRHGTVTLFAALSYLDGKIFSQTAAKHTHRQWLAFLKQLDRNTPPDLTLHLIADNYATHKHAKVKSWLRWRNQRQHKSCGSERVVLHFTPTSSSWMNLVERFFRDLTEDVVREGSFTSVVELVQAIAGYLDDRNLSPKRYVWKAKGEEILAKIQRAREALARNNNV